MKILYGLLRFVRRHKSLVTLLVFSLYIGVLDENSLRRLYELRRENDILRREIADNDEKYAYYSRQLSELSRPEAIERIARVELGMHTDDEDVYIIQVERDE